MAYPGVYITVANNSGPVVLSGDKITGMILTSDAAPSGLAHATAKKIFSLKEAEELGIDAAFDTAENSHAYRNLLEFYDAAPVGTPVWIMVLPSTETITDMCDKTNDFAAKLVDAAQGEIKVLGVSRIPDSGYMESTTNGLDDDVITAVAKLHALAEEKAGQMMPFRGILEGRSYQGDPALLEDLRAMTHNRAGVTLVSSENAVDGSHDGSASIGMLLGRIASIGVQRNIGRVKDGPLPIQQAYLSDGTTVEDAALELEAIHDKGYITARTFFGKAGYFFGDDPMATGLDDNYRNLSLGRTIDKAILLAYLTYVEEVQDDFPVDDEGNINPGLLKSYQASIERAIEVNMLNDQEISGVNVYIDPAQDVITTGKIEVELNITPVAYAKEISVKIGFTNPNN